MEVITAILIKSTNNEIIKYQIGDWINNSRINKIEEIFLYRKIDEREQRI